ncbi:MAG TPA: TetR/AcrR family transcriptional regulator [Flavipsychrobacter sp.]|nr:TetR/AcrR family transcriptional regulator [Flavipsychrobacter sp.]
MEPLTKILSASAELFRQYGFKTITMDDIARRAGISKKTLYQHFANKNEVVNESVTWYKCQITEMCNAAMNEAENAIQGMVHTMGMFDNIHRQVNPMAMYELERYYPEGFQRFREILLKQDISALKGNIERGKEEGLYRAEIDADVMARYRMEISLLFFHPNLLVTDRNNMHLVAREVGEHFLYGMMTPKGEKLYQKYKEKYLKTVSKI